VKRQSLIAIAFAGAVIGSAAPAAHAASYTPADYRDRLQKWINEYRVANGRPALAIGNHVQEAARAHSIDMRDHAFFSHNSSNGWSWVQRIRYWGCKQPLIGENIAVGYRTPLDTFRAWRASSAHRTVMLDGRFDWVGISMRQGVYRGGTVYYVTADFSGR
jgi:uncharacterized protein YkwD